MGTGNHPVPVPCSYIHHVTESLAILKKFFSLTMFLKSGTPLFVKHNGRRLNAHCVRVNAKSVRAMLASGTTITVPFTSVQIAKKKSMSRAHIPKADVCCTTKRLGRFRRIHVVPTRFSPSRTLGNFGAMLASEEYKASGVCMFNDNTGQFEFFGLNPSVEQSAGGGNAIARTMQHLGHSIGMPTGPFHSLTQQVSLRLRSDDAIQQHSAKAIIDEAICRIVRLFLSNDAKDTLYYSVNPNDPENSRRLGLAIFAGAVGDDVVDYISDQLQQIPALVQKYRVSGVKP